MHVNLKDALRNDRKLKDHHTEGSYESEMWDRFETDTVGRLLNGSFVESCPIYLKRVSEEGICSEIVGFIEIVSF